MAFVYNTTFVIVGGRREEFLSWMRGEAIPMLFDESSPASSPRLHAVAGVAEEETPREEGVSIALQAEFENESDLEAWDDARLNPVLNLFMSKFGPEAAFFCTRLEILPL